MGDQRAMQLVVRLVEAHDNRPAPGPPERLDEGDELVVRELMRRLSRPRE